MVGLFHLLHNNYDHPPFRRSFSGLKIISFIIAVLFLISSAPLWAEKPEPRSGVITAASFNIRQFSTGSRDDYELHNICLVVKDFDFIALQEVRDTEILERLVLYLKHRFNLPFSYIATGKLGRSSHTERYAFLFRNDKIEYMDTSGVMGDPEDVFIREPFFGKFRAGNFDFFAVSFHCIYGDTVRERREEVGFLDDVYRLVDAIDGDEDILFFGDFNLPPDDKAFDEFHHDLFLKSVNYHAPTTIKDNLYDAIWFNPEELREYTGSFGIVNFDEEMFFGYDDYASRIVSDHRPIWAQFFTGAAD